VRPAHAARARTVPGLLAACAAALACALTPALTGCGASPGPEASSPSSDPTSIAAIHMRKCGACHVRPEPGTRTRAHLEDAFTRHQRRVHLTPEQWSAMVDYLAAPPSPGAATDAPAQGLK
jgi:hypothetical protein